VNSIRALGVGFYIFVSLKGVYVKVPVSLFKVIKINTFG